MWLQPGENTGDCKKKLQRGCNHWCVAIAKKQLQKPACAWLQPCRMCVITTLSQCDCDLIAVWLQKKVAKTACDCDCKKRSKCDCKKPVQKSSMPWHCQIATRLVFAWCGCNLVKIRVIAKSVTVWLQPLMCCDCKKSSWKKQHVCDCNLVACAWLQSYRTVIAE
jgi:hypothetical protein